MMLNILVYVQQAGRASVTACKAYDGQTLILPNCYFVLLAKEYKQGLKYDMHHSFQEMFF